MLGEGHYYSLIFSIVQIFFFICEEHAVKFFCFISDSKSWAYSGVAGKKVHNKVSELDPLLFVFGHLDR